MSKYATTKICAGVYKMIQVGTPDKFVTIRSDRWSDNSTYWVAIPNWFQEYDTEPFFTKRAASARAKALLRGEVFSYD